MRMINATNPKNPGNTAGKSPAIEPGMRKRIAWRICPRQASVAPVAVSNAEINCRTTYVICVDDQTRPREVSTPFIVDVTFATNGVETTNRADIRLARKAISEPGFSRRR